ncbi:MAG: conjugal transfer protein TraX [Oscillospiraceae bacterium]|nr:conjugal transfer protein TraX [Oscillospiraceae bacterium]
MTSFTLKWLAVITMLIDHVGVALIPGGTPAYFVCRAVGRLAMPLFAFMIAEGYFYTKNYGKYMSRLIIFAFISEIPFDLILRGRFPSWDNQSIMVTFVVALAGLYFFDRFAAADKRFSALLALLASAFAAQLFNADYGAYGILIVFVFYFYRGRPRLLAAWYSAAVIIFAVLGAVSEMPYTNNVILSLLTGFALFSLIPILLYSKHRKKGYTAPVWQYFFYIFYPAHMMILYILSNI